MLGQVALCCISLKEKNHHLNEMDIYGLFNGIAMMSKMLIFQREPSFKCFIEFSEINSFENALRSIEKVSTVFGKVSLYPSPKESLKNAFDFNLLHQNKDKLFFNSDLKSNLIASNTSIQTTCSHSKPYNDHSDFSRFNDEFSTLLSSNSPFGPNKTSNNLSSPPIINSFYGNKKIKNQAHFDQYELKFIDFDENSLASMKLEHIKIMSIENVNVNKIRVNTIKNALGCFGNVLHLIINRQHNKVVAEFESINQANLIHIYLNGVTFFGCTLEVFYVAAVSLHQNISPNTSAIEFYTVEEKCHKFKKHLPIKFNPPSSILHFTSISDQVDCLILYELICQIHEPIKIYKLMKKTCRSDMYLVEFNSISESLEVLSVMHNKIIDHKSLKISFSHPEIN